MNKWMELTYKNAYNRTLKHHCFIRDLKDIKDLMTRYGIRSDDIIEVVIDDCITNIEKVRESLK